MLTITLRVTTEDDAADYEVTPRVQVAFEREFKVGIPKAFSGEQRMEYLYWLGWRSVQESGKVVKPFNDWLGSVRSVEIVESAAPS